MASSGWNRRLKQGWPAWVVLVVVAAGFLAVGATRDDGPHSQEDRVDAVTRRVACPVCDGESVFESRNSASRAIRNEVTDLVRANELGDAEIVAFLETRYGADVLLVPKASGLDALIWVLPAVGMVCGLAGLAVAFRRWKLQAAAASEPTAADRRLVEEALRAEAER